MFVFPKSDVEIKKKESIEKIYVRQSEVAVKLTCVHIRTKVVNHAGQSTTKIQKRKIETIVWTKHAVCKKRLDSKR